MMSDLRSHSDEELQKELERRLGAKAIPKPQRVECPDYRYLVELCNNYCKEVSNYGIPDEELKHLIFEAAMTAVYGNSIWDWVNAG